MCPLPQLTKKKKNIFEFEKKKLNSTHHWSPRWTLYPGENLRGLWELRATQRAFCAQLDHAHTGTSWLSRAGFALWIVLNDAREPLWFPFPSHISSQSCVTLLCFHQLWQQSMPCMPGTGLAAGT